VKMWKIRTIFVSEMKAINFHKVTFLACLLATSSMTRQCQIYFICQSLLYRSAAILSDTIFSHNRRHFVITDGIFNITGDDITYVTSYPMTSQSPPFCRILFLVTRDVIFL